MWDIRNAAVPIPDVRSAISGDLEDMPFTETPHDPEPDSFVPHYVADGEFQRLLEHDHLEREADRRAVPRLLTFAALAGVGLAIGALVLGVFAIAAKQAPVHDTATTVTAGTSSMPGMDGAAPNAAVASAAAPTIESAKGIKFEAYTRPDPTLPAVPAGAIKKFDVTVDEHVAQVSSTLAPTQVWTFGVNGKRFSGTGASTPMVVNQGDKVQITLHNLGTDGAKVMMPHSIDLHSAEVAPNVDYTDILPGKTKTISFVAKHPGVYMYHCATQPILMHDGSGMSGMMVVKPKGLPPAKELWLTQQEYFIGKAGGPADMTKIAAKIPDVIAFNGYADQYKAQPIDVKRGERVRLYVLNADVSTWSAFHVIGTVFNTTHVEGVVGHDSQTINLAPSQGGWVDLTLDQEGNYPFVTHAFGDMVKGAAGTLHTSGAPMPKTGTGH